MTHLGVQKLIGWQGAACASWQQQAPGQDCWGSASVPARLADAALQHAQHGLSLSLRLACLPCAAMLLHPPSPFCPGPGPPPRLPQHVRLADYTENGALSHPLDKQVWRRQACVQLTMTNAWRGHWYTVQVCYMDAARCSKAEVQLAGHSIVI